MNSIPLRNIPRGTPVYDLLGRPVGNVNYIQTPDIRRADPELARDNTFDNRQSFWDFAEDILELAFHGDDQFDEALVERLEANGYMHVTIADGSGSFVLADQIAHEEDGALYLNVEAGALLNHGVFPQIEG